MIRRLVPLLLIPLALLANVLAADPWLRAFPVSVGAVPLLGAAVLSVLVPAVSYRVGARLWLGAVIDVLALVLFLLFVVLHDPTGFHDIAAGLHRGPSQILTFALPLVSPRSLMVGPTVLIWVAGAVAGECLARRWATLLPYVGLLASFGLAYAGTQRATTDDVLSSLHLRDTLLAGGLLVTLLLMRTAQAWVRQDDSAESTQADGVLPLRGFVTGVVTAVAVTLAASLLVQATAFPKQSSTPQRQPIIDQSAPLAPLQFVASLRPAAGHKSAPVFTVRLGTEAPGYFGIANLDFYDGAGWSFDRTFRPSGGILPGDADSSLTSSLTDVTQRYTIADGSALSTAPWIPALYRAQRVSGASVDIDPGSGMIVPAGALADGTTYTVDSQIPSSTFASIDPRRATPDTSTPAEDVQIPPTLRTNLDKLIENFVAETGTPSQPALPFLAALRTTLLDSYSLSGAAQGIALGTRTAGTSSSATTSSPAPTGSSGRPKSGTPKSGAHSGDALHERPLSAKTSGKSPGTSPAKAGSSSGTPASSNSSASDSAAASAKLAGGTGFADIVASVLGQQRAGTPEQFATLMALVARELGVPARVVTGFRKTHGSDHSAMLPADSYDVTTRSAWTWAEVPIVGKGWVVLDATPGLFSDTNRTPDAGASASPTPTDTPSQALISESSSGGHAIAPEANPPAAASASSTHGLLVALLLVAGVLVVVLLLLLASRKRIRRARRRRAADPRAQLLGAWHESLDMLTEAGLPELTTLTSAEIAELTGEQFGAAPREQTELLGRAANSVAYSAATVVEPQAVDEAWAAQRTLRRAVRSQLRPGARVAAALRYHRSKRIATARGPQSWAIEAADRALHDRPRQGGRGTLARRSGSRYQGRRRR